MKPPRVLVLMTLLTLGLALAVTGRVQRPLDRGEPPGIDLAVRIDVNRADAAELRLLPGIGPALAQRVVKHRRVHGPFASAADLERVSGIGPGIRRRVEPFITTSPPPEP